MQVQVEDGKQALSGSFRRDEPPHPDSDGDGCIDNVLDNMCHPNIADQKQIITKKELTSF